MIATIIKASAGFGKTVAFAIRVAYSSTLPVEVYVPTHLLGKEWRDLILKNNPNKRVVVIGGRSAVGNDGKPLCKKYKLADELSRAGVQVFPHLCRRDNGKNKPATLCQYYQYCNYIKQYQPADVYIYTHAHIPLRRNSLESWHPANVVIDESFFTNCIEHIPVPISLLSDADLPDGARPLCRDIITALRSNEALKVRFLDAQITSTEFRDAIRALSKVASDLTPNMSQSAQRKALSRIQSFAPVKALLEQLAAETQLRHPLQSVVFDAEKQVVMVHRRREISRFSCDGKQPSIHILDASASDLIIGKLFEVKEIVKFEVARNAIVTQVHSVTGSTQSLVPSLNGSRKSANDAKRRLRELEGFVERKAAGGKRGLIIGTTAVVGNPKKSKKPLFKIPGHCEFAHFKAVRGIDRWRDFDFVVIVGRNQPPIKAMEDEARALFWDDATPLTLGNNWGLENRGFRTKLDAQGVPVQVHSDLRIQAVVEQHREYESVQALDRLRLIHNDIPKEVFIICNVPLDVDVDIVGTWDEIINGGNRLERAWAAQTDGVMPLNPAWLAEHHADLWPTEGAAKQDVGRVRRRGQTSNSIYIRNLSLFEYEYRLTGQKRGSWCLSQFPAAAQTEEALQNLLGQAVTVRPPSPLGAV